MCGFANVQMCGFQMCGCAKMYENANMKIIICISAYSHICTLIKTYLILSFTFFAMARWSSILGNVSPAKVLVSLATRFL
jgi:hypothetical protein